MDATDYTRPTIESVLDEFAERNLIERDASGVTPTLVTRLIWDTYQLVDSYLASIAAPDSDAPRWPTAADRRVVLELLADRRDVLKCIEPAPGDIRALVDTLDASRSTVTRAIRELSVAGLVERTADGYTISPTGHQAIKQYCTSLKTIADILVAQDILGELPLKCSIKPTLLANADVADTADCPRIVYQQAS